jgi:hypothetical protein
MKMLKRLTPLIFIMAIGSFNLGFSTEVSVINQRGEEERFVVEKTDSFLTVLEYIGNYLEDQELKEGQEWLESNSKHLHLDLMICEAGMTVKPFKKNINSRNYQSPVSPQEKKEIRYIITTLAQNSLTNIASSKSTLKKAGDRIDHIHPLRFLSTVFTDEELKVGVHAIRDRGWIWDEFLSGIIGSFKEESAHQNMKAEFIHDFATNVGINVYFVLQPIQEGRWKDLINVLIDTIPRANDPNRYNM